MFMIDNSKDELLTNNFLKAWQLMLRIAPHQTDKTASNYSEMFPNRTPLSQNSGYFELKSNLVYQINTDCCLNQ